MTEEHGMNTLAATWGIATDSSCHTVSEAYLLARFNSRAAVWFLFHCVSELPHETNQVINVLFVP